VGTKRQHHDTNTDKKKLTANRNSEMVRPTAADRSLSHPNGGTPLMTDEDRVTGNCRTTTVVKQDNVLAGPAYNTRRAWSTANSICCALKSKRQLLYWLYFKETAPVATASEGMLKHEGFQGWANLQSLAYVWCPRTSSSKSKAIHSICMNTKYTTTFSVRPTGCCNYNQHADTLFQRYIGERRYV